MKIESAIKVIWLSVGVLLLGCILVGIFLAVWFNLSYNDTNYQEQGITIDNSTKEKLERVELELTYGSPIPIGNSENYMLKVYVTYQEDESTLKAGFDSYSKDMDVDQPSNVIFLNKDLAPVQTLLTEKALIKSLRYPSKQTQDDVDYEGSNKNFNFILYEIVMKDSDGNGQLDTDDESDLYISDLDGGNLTQITKGLLIKEVEFLNEYETVLVQYIKRSNKENKSEAAHFASYSISKKELAQLTPLDAALQKVHTILTK